MSTALHHLEPTLLAAFVTALVGCGSQRGGTDWTNSGAGETGTSAIDTSLTTESASGKPPGGSCEIDADCESGVCWTSEQVGGACSECADDSDCAAGGCTRPTVLDAEAPSPFYATCNEGALGDGCTTTDACHEGLLCAVVFDIVPFGVGPNRRCSECASDEDCVAGELCSPVYDLVNLGGHRACVAAGSVALGEGCDLASSGDLACAAGFCTAVSHDDWPSFGGVCGQCEQDDDCAGENELCRPPVLTFGVQAGLTLEPSECVDVI